MTSAEIQEWRERFKSKRELPVGKKLQAGDYVWMVGNWCPIPQRFVGFMIGKETAILYGTNVTPTFGRTPSMTTLIAQPHETKPLRVSNNIKSALELILAKELALSLARKILVSLDRLPNADFDCNIICHGKVVEINLEATPAQFDNIRTYLMTYPFASDGFSGTIVLGQVEESHVNVNFRPVSIKG